MLIVDILPEEVRARPKSVVPVDIVQIKLADKASFDSLDLSFKKCTKWIDEEQYVQALKRYSRGEDIDRFSVACPLSLVQWVSSDKLL